MITAQRALIGALLATGLAVGGAAVASARDLPTLPAPIVSMSTLTLANRDSVAVVVVFTKRCDASLCPNRWRVLVTTEDGRVSHTLTVLRDTIRIAKPICPSSYTLKASVIGDATSASAGTVSSPAGTASLLLPCRPLTAPEAASLDSYPDVHFVIPGTQQPRTVGDSVDTAPCWIGKNRYNGNVHVFNIDPEHRCEDVARALLRPSTLRKDG